ncbi:flagella synthesis protein FlgN [Achromobacter sp. DMS1]|uniref:flagella synthesis protein FlgN n=1 Tax=Achromobacter sp. DMS1 TaxID=1688405 RepID=UPI000B327757|nr:flagellar protein FlgN [Achromobacter sp. DMS1]
MSNTTVESLQTCLRQEDALVAEFAVILEQETEVLVGPGDVDALSKVTERKNEVALKLVELSQQRDRLLADAGLPPGHAGTEQAVSRHPRARPKSGRRCWPSPAPPTKSICATAP